MVNIMWRIFNKIFGWHYIEYRDKQLITVARVYKLPTGVWRMKGPSFIRGEYRYSYYDINLKLDGTFAYGNGRWIPLTWVPHKWNPKD